MQDTEKKPDVKFRIDGERVLKVATALGGGDVSECLAPDVKHVRELLAHVLLCERLAPGFLDEMFATFLPLFVQNKNRATLGEIAQQKADAEGFGEEWREAIKAGMHPQKKDFIARTVALHMKLNDENQNSAIKAMAEQTGRDEDSIRRVVTRSKRREK